MHRGGTKLRHINSNSLRDLELQLEMLKHKVEIKAINNVSGQWYIHFTLRDFDPDPDVTKTVEEKLKVETQPGINKKRVGRPKKNRR